MKIIDHLNFREGTALEGVGGHRRAAPYTTTGAVETIDVAGNGAFIIELTANLDGLSFTGWDTTPGLRQRIRIKIIQDAAGGHVFNWQGVDGRWTEDLSNTVLDVGPVATTLLFDVETLDGGTTVSLEPVGIQYQLDCTYADISEGPLPATTAGGSLLITHSFDVVSDVTLINLATGDASKASWARSSPTSSASSLLLTFAQTHPAGTFNVLLTGKPATPCVLSSSASEYYTLALSTASTNVLSPIVVWTGANDAAWVWGDGTAPEMAATATEQTHNYAPNYAGPVAFRYRKGIQITRFQSVSDEWDFDVSQLSPLKQLDWVDLRATNVSGDISVFAQMPAMAILWLNQSNVVGDVGSLAGLTGLTTLDIHTSGVGGDVAGLSGLTSLTELLAQTTNLSGDVGSLATLTALNRLTLNSTSVIGDIAPLSTLTSLNTLWLNNTSISGDIAALATMTGLISLRLGLSNVTGDSVNLSGLTALTELNFTGSAIGGAIGNLSTLTGLTSLNAATTAMTGDISTLAALTSLTALRIENNAVSGDPSALVAAMPNLTAFNYFDITGMPPTVAQLDAVVDQLVANGLTGGNLQIGGSNPAVTASANLNTLKTTLGWTVVHN